jgi:hypothetical protein
MACKENITTSFLDDGKNESLQSNHIVYEPGALQREISKIKTELTDQFSFDNIPKSNQLNRPAVSTDRAILVGDEVRQHEIIGEQENGNGEQGNRIGEQCGQQPLIPQQSRGEKSPVPQTTRSEQPARLQLWEEPDRVSESRENRAADDAALLRKLNQPRDTEELQSSDDTENNKSKLGFRVQLYGPSRQPTYRKIRRRLNNKELPTQKDIDDAFHELGILPEKLRRDILDLQTRLNKNKNFKPKSKLNLSGLILSGSTFPGVSMASRRISANEAPAPAGVHKKSSSITASPSNLSTVPQLTSMDADLFNKAQLLVCLANDMSSQLQQATKFIRNWTCISGPEHEWLVAINQKNYNSEMDVFRKAFLGNSFDTRPHFIIPTSRADKARIDSMIGDFQAKSLEYCKDMQTTFDAHKWYGLWHQLHICALNDEELHDLRRIRGQLAIEAARLPHGEDILMDRVDDNTEVEEEDDGFDYAEVRTRLARENPMFDFCHAQKEDIKYYNNLLLAVEKIQDPAENHWAEQMDLMEQTKMSVLNSNFSMGIIRHNGLEREETWYDRIPDMDIPRLNNLVEPALATYTRATPMTVEIPMSQEPTWNLPPAPNQPFDITAQPSYQLMHQTALSQNNTTQFQKNPQRLFYDITSSEYISSPDLRASSRGSMQVTPPASTTPQSMQFVNPMQQMTPTAQHYQQEYPPSFPQHHQLYAQIGYPTYHQQQGVPQQGYPTGNATHQQQGVPQQSYYQATQVLPDYQSQPRLNNPAFQQFRG